MRLGGCFRPRSSTSFWKRSRSSARSMLSGLVPMIGTPAAEPEWSLASVLDDSVFALPPPASREHDLGRQWFEAQAVVRVVVGRHALGAAVDHEGLEPVQAQRHGCMHAAEVEFDALPDP